MEVIEAKPHNPEQMQPGEYAVVRADKRRLQFAGSTETRGWVIYSTHPATDKGMAAAKAEAEWMARTYPKYEYAVINVIGVVKVKPVEPPVEWTVSL